MKRRYVIMGNVGQWDAETGDVVAPGGVITLDELDIRTVGLLSAGVLQLEKEVDPATREMTCPLCVEIGVKRPPAFSDSETFARHYNDRHSGFVVPEWKGGESS